MAGFDKPLKLDDCTLYFAGHCADIAKLPDIQNTYKLFTVTHGSGVVHTFNDKYSVKSGDAFVMLPYEIFGINSSSDALLCLNCIYFTSDSAKFNEMLGSIRICEIGGNDRILRDRSINESVDCVVNELKAEKPFTVEMVSLMCSQFMLYIMRAFDKRQPDAWQSEDTGINLCTSIINYIDNRIYTVKNLSEVADALGYNYSYLSNLFRKTFGITLNRYFISKKMQEAEKLLLETRQSVSKIAQRLNYSSVYAFSKAFKEYYGESPVNYKKKHR